MSSGLDPVARSEYLRWLDLVEERFGILIKVGVIRCGCTCWVSHALMRRDAGYVCAGLGSLDRNEQTSARW